MTIKEIEEQLDNFERLAAESREMYSAAMRGMYHELRKKQDDLAGQLAGITAELSRLSEDIRRISENIEKELDL